MKQLNRTIEIDMMRHANETHYSYHYSSRSEKEIKRFVGETNFSVSGENSLKNRNLMELNRNRHPSKFSPSQPKNSGRVPWRGQQVNKLKK